MSTVFIYVSLVQSVSAAEAFTPDYEQVQTFPPDQKFFIDGTPVGHLYLRLPDGQTTPWCTGLAVSRNVVLTARHCVYNEQGEYYPEKGMLFVLHQVYPAGGEVYQLDLPPIETGKENLDFVLLNSKTAFVGQLKIPTVGGDVEPGAKLYIYHYPGESLLTLTENKCNAAEALEGVSQPDFLNHTCTVESGSSGAPILDDDFRLVGLHTNGGKGPTTIDSAPKVLPNQGIKIAILLKGSPRLASLLSGAGTSTGETASPTNSGTPTISYRTDGGKLFTLEAGKWYFAAENQKRTLREQAGDGDKFVLWDSNTDTIYELPKAGGSARFKRGKDVGWQTLGTVQVND
jgi:V8-like Glu-specific endopeptidase